MRRTTCALLLSALVPGLLLVTALTPASAAPRPVPPAVVELAVSGIDRAAASEPVDGALATAGGTRRTVLLTARQATAGYGMVGVTWRPDKAVTGVQAWVRTRTDAQWSPWTLAGGQADEDPDGAEAAGAVRAGTAPLWVGQADGVQVRVDVLAGTDPQDLRVALVDPGASPADDAVAQPRASLRAAGVPAIRSRAEWGADESLRRAAPSYASGIQAVIVHHTASTNDYAPADVPRLLRGFYAYHVKSRGWSDLAYNVLVDRFGTIWEGRAGGVDRAVIGSHAGGFNTGTVGVSMIGTYETVAPSAAQRESVAQVVAWRMSAAGLDPRSSVRITSGGGTRWPAGTVLTLPRVLGHRQVSSTTCPGARGFAALPGIRERAAALAGGAAPTAGILQVVVPSSARPGSTVGLSVRGGAPYARVEVYFARRGEPVAARRRAAVLSAAGSYRTSFTADDDWTVFALSEGRASMPATVRRTTTTADPRYPSPVVTVTGPMTADQGSQVLLTARGPAGAAVSIWFRREGQDEFLRRREGRFDRAGRFTTSYAADRPYDWFALTSTATAATASEVGTTGTGPVPDGLHVYAPPSAVRGRLVTLVVQGAPGAPVAVWFARRGEDTFSRRREGVLAADGTYRTSYLAYDDQAFFATTGARSSTRETTRVSSATVPAPPGPPQLSLVVPAAVEAGAPVEVTVTGPSGAPVELWSRARAARTFRRVGQGSLDATGRFSTTYLGTDDHDLWVASGARTSRDAAVLTLPVLTGPSSVALGSRVVLAGRARPGDAVVVESRRRGATTPVRTTMTADAAGAFRTSFAADDEYELRPSVGSRLGAVRRTTVTPTLTGPAAAAAGSPVELTGTARPGASVQLWLRPDGAAPSLQVAGRRPRFALGGTVVADATGRYRTSLVLTGRQTLYARADGNASGARTLTVR